MRLNSWLMRIQITTFLLLCRSASTANVLKSPNSNLVHEAVGVSSSSCNIYLAPSSLPNAGMGIYTARSVKKGSIINYQDGPLIPIIDMGSSNEFSKGFMNLFSSYIWGQPQATSAEMKFEADQVVDFQISVGMFPNFHTLLYNLNFRLPMEPYDDSFENISLQDNPGAGAFSNHKGRDFTADRDVEEGEEIFLNYGEQYLEGRSHLDHVPRAADYYAAAKILKRLFARLKRDGVLVSTMERPDTEGSEEIIDNAFSEIKESSRLINQRVDSILPKTIDEIQRIYNEINKSKSDNFEESVSFAIARNSLSKRDVSWLKKNGICLDNIKPGPSILPYAGQGAKARRFLPKGELIVPAPLLQIMNRDVLSTHKVLINNDGSFDHHYNEQVGSQILLNYCFGRKESSLLLCPTTNAILINHCSDDCGISSQGPNARVQWSRDKTTQKWLGMTLEEMSEQSSRGLSIDIIALRDISPGEEIFIDYGLNWENSWDNHDLHWEEKLKEANSGIPQVSTTILNELETPLESLTTGFKEGGTKQIFTGCLYWEDDSVPQIRPNLRGTWKYFDDEKILARFSSSGSHFELENIDYKRMHNAWWPCSVVRKEDDKSNTYTVRIFQADWRPPTMWTEANIPRFLTEFPEDSIRFFHVPYSSPMHMKEAFRHSIEIPLEMFPKQWLNRPSPFTKFRVGDTVERWYHNGKIVKAYDRKYDIMYDSGQLEEGVHEVDIIPAHLVLSSVRSHPYS